MARMLLFGAAREAAGTHDVEVDAGQSLRSTLDAASARFGARFEQVLTHCTVALDGEVVPAARTSDDPVASGAEIAVLPPMSGGSQDATAVPVRMIDVKDKSETERSAVAGCRLTTTPRVRAMIVAGELKKGDALASAKVAGMLAAKRTPELLPMCHPVRLTFVEVTCAPVGDDGIDVIATIRGRDRTGFEMEALTAASIAALTLHDMAKGEDPEIVIDDLKVVRKTGGKSGDWTPGA